MLQEERSTYAHRGTGRPGLPMGEHVQMTPILSPVHNSKNVTDPNYHFSPLRLAKIKRADTLRAGGAMGEAGRLTHGRDRAK